MRILLIEDEPKVAAFIQTGLQKETYWVDVSHDGEDGEAMALAYDYDLIILDLMLPGKDGYALCRELRNRRVESPILMLTAQGSLGSKIKGLDSGADDYMTKPFDFAELLARIRALLRRRGERNPMLVLADLTVDPVAHQVERSGQIIGLTAQEYRLLEYLMRHKGMVISRQRLAEQAWGDRLEGDSNVVEVYVNYLRNKIDKPFSVKLLHTVRGMGYVLQEDPS